MNSNCRYPFCDRLFRILPLIHLYRVYADSVSRFANYRFGTLTINKDKEDLTSFVTLAVRGPPARNETYRAPTLPTPLSARGSLRIGILPEHIRDASQLTIRASKESSLVISTVINAYHRAETLRNGSSQKLKLLALSAPCDALCSKRRRRAETRSPLSREIVVRPPPS